MVGWAVQTSVKRKPLGHSARLVAARAMLARQDILLNSLFGAPWTFVVDPGHMSNRFATISAKDVDLVVKVFEWGFFEELVTFKEVVVV